MPLKTEIHDQVAILTFNLPDIRNAMTAEMRVDFREQLEKLADDKSVDVVIVTGNEAAFCAGGDVRTMGETDPVKIRERMDCVASAAETLVSFPKITIAAVAGHAAGAGVSVSCLCDIVVAEETATFTFSHLKLALAPDWGLSWSLPRRVGRAAAQRLILTRAAINGAEAHRLGLVDVLVPARPARDKAISIARELIAGPRESIAAVKKVMSEVESLRAALKAETAMQLERFPHWEHQEGARAFKEKRPADYKGAKVLG
jgi:2-(1,2-epoxy-1,2-dihydrophenyl)acetyl-CoA isomerase